MSFSENNRILVAKILRECPPSKLIDTGAQIVKLGEASRDDDEVLHRRLLALYEANKPIITLEEASRQLEKFAE
jgi:hypothetical protein